MPIGQVAKALGNQTSQLVRRSNIFTALLVFAVILMLGIGMISFAKDRPQWLLPVLSVCLVLDFVLFALIYLAAYKKDPNLLRSDSHSMVMTAIERSFLGDSVTGGFYIEGQDFKYHALPLQSERKVIEGEARPVLAPPTEKKEETK